VPNASDDLPEPDTPVNTTRASRGNIEIDAFQIVLACAAHADEAPQSLFRGFSRTRLVDFQHVHDLTRGERMTAERSPKTMMAIEPMRRSVPAEAPALRRAPLGETEVVARPG
jgi:hypothetical protein